MCNLQFLVAVDTADPLFVIKDIRERGWRVSVRVLYMDHILNGYAPLINVAPERTPDQFVINEEVKFIGVFVFITRICIRTSMNSFPAFQ